MQRKLDKAPALIKLGSITTQTKGVEPEGKQDTVGLHYTSGISAQD